MGLEKLNKRLNERDVETRVTALVAAAMPQYGRDFTFKIDPNNPNNPVSFRGLNKFGMHFVNHIQEVAKNSKPFMEEYYERKRSNAKERLRTARRTNKNMDGQPPDVGSDGQLGTRDPDLPEPT